MQWIQIFNVKVTLKDISGIGSHAKIYLTNMKNWHYLHSKNRDQGCYILSFIQVVVFNNIRPFNKARSCRYFSTKVKVVTFFLVNNSRDRHFYISVSNRLNACQVFILAQYIWFFMVIFNQPTQSYNVIANLFSVILVVKISNYF